MAEARMLRKGELVPSFTLESETRRGRIGPWDYKQRSSLVILILHGTSCDRCRARLESTASLYGEIRAIEAEVLAVMDDDVEALRRLALELRTPFPLLSDADGSVRSEYAGTGVGLFLVDRYNALFEGWVAPDADALPDTDEVRGWLAFLDIQCEECHPPESCGRNP
jgi:peroxiredoxin